MPAINVGDGVITNELADTLQQIERFDIVIFRPTKYTNRRGISADEKWVMRIIGLGGETIEMRKGKVFINGRPLVEPFKTMPCEDDFAPFKIPVGEYFLLGDNRPDSEDSRYWRTPTIKNEDVLAEVVQVVRK